MIPDEFAVAIFPKPYKHEAPASEFLREDVR